jgi:hypothetical protein
MGIEFRPEYVYGSVEHREDYLPTSALGAMINYYAMYVNKGYGCGIIYGVPVRIEDTFKSSFHGKDDVDAFAHKHNLEKPTFHLCIGGDFEIYVPEEHFSDQEYDGQICDDGGDGS